MSEYNIKVQLDQNNLSFLYSKDQGIISAPRINGIYLPNSCCYRVCTSSASMILEESLNKKMLWD